MTPLNDGFGDQPLEPDTFVEDMDGWIRHRAHSLCWTSATKHKVDDVAQEGRIMLWRTYAELGDPELAMAKAHFRMKHLALNEDAYQTGQTRRAPDSVQRNVASVDWPSLIETLADVDSLVSVETAYHDGEIQQAIDSLTERQRRYVYARFWCGMDPEGMHMNEGMRMARTNNPDLRRDILWTGSKRAYGAKWKLAEALGHLRGLVDA